MKNNMTELVFILDRSGSMSGFEADTVGGFNSVLEKNKKTRWRLPYHDCALRSRNQTAS